MTRYTRFCHHCLCQRTMLGQEICGVKSVDNTGDDEDDVVIGEQVEPMDEAENEDNRSIT